MTQVLILFLGGVGGACLASLVWLSKVDRAEAEAFLRGAHSEADRRDGIAMRELDDEWDELGGPYYDYDWSRP